jgi:TonB family protein
MTGLRIALAAASLFQFAAPAAAQSRAPVWQMDWGNQYCSLIRLPDRATPYMVAVRALPGHGYSNVLLVARGYHRPPPRIDSILLLPSGRSFDVTTGEEPLGDGTRAISLGRLPVEFWNVLASSNQMELNQGVRTVGQVPLIDAAAAVRALRQCVSDALRQWGVDEAALNAVRRPAVSTNDLGVEPEDYPREAIRQNIQGRVVVRIDVSAEGRATACAAVASSRTRVIDAAVCQAAMTRGRFTPALDANGVPTHSQIITTVTFFMPDS